MALFFFFHYSQFNCILTQTVYNFAETTYFKKSTNQVDYPSLHFKHQRTMATYAFDVDDSSASPIQMTQAQICVFSKEDNKIQENEEKQKSRSRRKNKSKKSKSKLKQEQSKMKLIANKDKRSKSKGSQLSKDLKKLSSKSKLQQSQQEQIEKPKRGRRKSQIFVKRTPPQQRFFQQIKQSQLVKYGNAKFVKKGLKSPVLAYSKKAKETIRTGVTWWISDGEYVDKNWSEIFSDLYQIEVRDLRLNNNNYPNIIRQIHHVRFDHLEILNLYENNISSIELLSRMRIPQLKDLSLRNNKITSLKSMAKMSLKNLVHLSIADNYILRMDKFFCINTASLEQIFIDWSNSFVIAEDMSWMAKLKKNPKPSKVMGYMQKVVIQSKSRIPQKAVDQMLINKYRKNQLLKRK